MPALRRMEQASPYVFAGQYRQRPSPPAGGTIKPDMIEIVDAQMSDIIRKVTVERGQDPEHFTIFSYGGAGGLHGTTADYFRFAQMLLNGGELDGVRLLSPRTLERWRWSGKGPAFVKLGGRVVYRLEVIETFEAEGNRTITGRVQ